MMSNSFYPIGTPGRPWGKAERNRWRASQSKQRGHQDDVVRRIGALADRFETLIPLLLENTVLQAQKLILTGQICLRRWQQIAGPILRNRSG